MGGTNGGRPLGDEFRWCCWPHPASLSLLREGLLMGSAVPAALADVGQWVWKCCKAPEALRRSGRRQAHSAQALCRGERSPIRRAPEGRKSVGQWLRFCVHPSAAGCERGRCPRSRPWVIRSGLTASASRYRRGLIYSCIFGRFLRSQE